MMLGEIIKVLEKLDPKIRLPLGFHNPHSYRGYYEQLAFEPEKNITVKKCLTACLSAIGKTYRGYKGGEYVMSEFTQCWLAESGQCGETIGPYLLQMMIDASEHKN